VSASCSFGELIYWQCDLTSLLASLPYGDWLVGKMILLLASWSISNLTCGSGRTIVYLTNSLAKSQFAVNRICNIVSSRTNYQQGI